MCPVRCAIPVRVTDDDIMRVLRSLPRRSGIERLARLLGFGRPLRRCAVPGAARHVRSAHVTRRGDLQLHAVRLRSRLTSSTIRSLFRFWQQDEPAAYHIALLLEPGARRIAVACESLDDEPRHTLIEPAAIRPVDVEIVRELAASAARAGTAALWAVTRALDRRTLTDRFFRDVRAVRDLIARSWTGVPASAVADREALALLLLSRLLFLYFLQRDGLLAGDDRFLPSLLARWQRGRSSGTFYRSVLRTLFFGVLNRRPERRTARAAALGALPYLNGGLFEMHRVERRHSTADLSDGVATAIFSMLLDRYRFTAADAADYSGDEPAAGIDPELLGRIFEGLMGRDQRSRTGTFYTPAGTVDRLVVECLVQHVSAACGVDDAALERFFQREHHDLPPHEIDAAAASAATLRVLDPACGSGAFLLGALARLAQLRSAAGTDSMPDQIRRDIVASSLHGVDLLDDAALICALRMWLALVPRCSAVTDVPPLPNLDRCIRQGDALVDPLDIRAGAHAWSDARRLRMIVRQLEPAGRQYVTAGPETRAALRRRLQRLETGLARAWINAALNGAGEQLAEMRVRATDRDLFGEPTAAARVARERMPSLERRREQLNGAWAAVAESGTIPFFSFPVHFPAQVDGFDLIISNPPWVRAHAWPAATTALLRDRYHACRSAGWPYVARLPGGTFGAGAQVDLAFLFLERSIHLLRPGGTLGMLLPAKLLRSIAPGGARALLLADARITYIEDHSLDQRAVFRADAFTAAIVARRTAQCDEQPVRVRMTRGAAMGLEFDVDRADLPLRRGDDRAPWLLAPPDCAEALRLMQASGCEIGRTGLTVRRGAMTNANARMLVAQAVPRLGDLVEITTTAGAQGVIESDCLRPVLRGADVRAWHARPAQHVLWSPANDGGDVGTRRRFGTFVNRHVRSYDARHRGTVERISRGMFGHKVVWSDLAPDLRAAAVPALVRSCGAARPVVPLNTVYFIAAPGRADALLLSAYLNSLPLRTYARAIAERAKDAHFRFFAWTIAMLPLPADWRHNEHTGSLLGLAERAHDDGMLRPDDAQELDDTVARCYGLGPARVAALAAFDTWLRGD